MEFRGRRNLVKRLLFKTIQCCYCNEKRQHHIIDGDTVYQNTTGNAALATAGSMMF
jgi:NAD(P)H-hydrate repair Nnr-like enzyme with NAD(P)H-hydrate dehydratase domain